MANTFQLPSSSKAPYVLPSVPWVTTTSLITTGDTGLVPTRFPNGANGQWHFAGTPDGLGAMKNADGTFTVIVNHEIASGGVVRDHGFNGAFVDILTLDANFNVVSGDDLAQSAFSWDVATGAYVPLTSAWTRFCSGDLAAPSAFYDVATGLGTQERIYLTGEEAGNTSRAFAFVITDTDKADGTAAGSAWELPTLGHYSFENSAANAFTGAKTVVISQDDTTPGQVYVYVGDKQATGSAIDKAGLLNGHLYGIKVPSMLLETNATALPAAGAAFSLQEMGGVAGDVKSMTGAQLEAESAAEGVTSFLRPEDGAWDPSNPDRYYFVTTNGIGVPSRLWALDFANAQDPTAGGTVKMLLDGTEGQAMFDNITVAEDGKVYLQEDVGNNARLGKIWMYDAAIDGLTELAAHDANLFSSTSPNFVTADEESSGIIDVTSIMGDGKTVALMFDTQSHKAVGGELVEGGQLQLMNVDLQARAGFTGGTNGIDNLVGGAGDDKLDGDFGNDRIIGGGGNDTLLGNYGDDVIGGKTGNDVIDGGVGADTLYGDEGDDVISGGVGNDKLDGGIGDDSLDGGVGDDSLVGGAGNDMLLGGYGNDRLEGGQGDDVLLGGNGVDHLAGGSGIDTLTGGFGADIFEYAKGSGVDVITDFQVGVDKLFATDGVATKSSALIDYNSDGVLDTVLHLNGGATIALLGVTDFGLSDFI